MLNAAIYIVFALLLIVCALLLLVVLMQRPKQEGLGAAFGAQMTDQAFGAQTTDVLKKGTVLFGTLFMGLCFVLAVLMNARFQNEKSDLNVKKVEAPVEQSAPAAVEQPAAPVENLENLAPAPAAEGEGPVPAPTPALEAAPAPAEQPAA
ncbi:MAG: preprotein translocase subunit SecG [Akkermansia sp.]|jgi:preprotein translocase subunit SecG|nr:preprotein translocase subunit SecG [Akkermansia sp.]